jgi:hypothetical protein
MIITGNENFLHTPDKCKGELCVFHNPSEHRMRNWPMNLRETALVERMCPHGVGHPHPDSAASLKRIWLEVYKDTGMWYTHGCDGCCFGSKIWNEEDLNAKINFKSRLKQNAAQSVVNKKF